MIIQRAFWFAQAVPAQPLQQEICIGSSVASGTIFDVYADLHFLPPCPA